MYASLLGICPQKTRTPHPLGGSPVSGALHLGVFEQPEHQVFFRNLVEELKSKGGMEEVERFINEMVDQYV